jgi:hypothetical protein
MPQVLTDLVVTYNYYCFLTVLLLGKMPNNQYFSMLNKIPQFEAQQQDIFSLGLSKHKNKLCIVLNQQIIHININLSSK